MKLFLKKILIFTLLVVCLFAIGEMVVRGLDTPYRYKAETLRADGKKYNTLILGSSLLYYGLNPTFMGDSVFNLANISQTPEYDFALLKEFHPSVPNLKRVIVPISYCTYRDPVLEEISPGLCVQYKVGMKLPLHSDLSIYNLSLTDFKSYAGRLRNLIAPQELNRCDSLGFGLGFDLSHRAKNWESTGSRRARDLTQTSPGRCRRVEEVINDMIAYCQNHGIEVVFVTTPMWKSFRENVDPEQYAEMRQEISKLRGKKGVRYFDFYSSEQFVDEDFHDPDHLSDYGARKLSTILMDSLRTTTHHCP